MIFNYCEFIEHVFDHMIFNCPYNFFPFSISINLNILLSNVLSVDVLFKVFITINHNYLF